MTYLHKEDTHNLNAPEMIAPIIYNLVKPTSIIDIGCGVGTFLYAFKSLNVKKVHGVDGAWVNSELLERYLTEDEFTRADLSKPFVSNEKYDLVLCLEVAEHIKEEDSENLIQTLVNAGDLILFSAAVPYQSGQNHVNEQWPTYWKQKFSRFGYQLIDTVRQRFWNMDMPEFWYKQNVFFVVKEACISKYSFLANHVGGDTLDLIHPDLYLKNSEQLYAIEKGAKPILFYMKLLVKAALNRNKI